LETVAIFLLNVWAVYSVNFFKIKTFTYLRLLISGTSWKGLTLKALIENMKFNYSVTNSPFPSLPKLFHGSLYSTRLGFLELR
jgi:hypothetical protein